MKKNILLTASIFTIFITLIAISKAIFNFAKVLNNYITMHSH